MRHWLAGLMLLIAPSAFAQQAVPVIRFDSVPNPLKLPPNMYFGEVSGVAVNSKGHVFVFSRGNTTGPGLWRRRGAAAGVRRRTASSSARSARTSTPGRSRTRCASTSRTTSGSPTRARTWSSSSIPRAASLMVFGRKQEASDEDTGPLKHPKPPLPADDGRFRQVDRRRLGPRRQHLHQRRLHQFARRQGRQERQLAEVVGRPRQRAGPVQHAAQHRRRRPGQRLCRRPRQPPHPGVRRRRQLPARDHASTCRSTPDAQPAIGNNARRRKRPQARRHHRAGRAVDDLHHAAARTRCCTRPTPIPAASTS